jgi:hypothetical protein
VGAVTGARAELWSQLVDALRRRYTGYDELDLFLQLELGRPLADLAAPGPLGVVVLHAVRAAEAQGWLTELVEAAVADSPGNAQLAAVAAAITALPPDAPGPAEPGPAPNRPPQVCAVFDVTPRADDGERTRTGDLVGQALATASLPQARVGPGTAPHRLVVDIDAPADAVAGPFLRALRALAADRDTDRDPRDRRRVTATLTDAARDGALEGALRIADAPVLARVVEHVRNGALVVALSEDVYHRAGRLDGGYAHVRSGADTFWIGVPGLSRPPGLSQHDAVAPAGMPGPGSRRLGDVTVFGNVHGDLVAGDKTTYPWSTHWREERA